MDGDGYPTPDAGTGEMMHDGEGGYDGGYDASGYDAGGYGMEPEPLLRTEGWMKKKGGGTSFGGRHNWKRRWFKLIGLQLAYFGSPRDEQPKGVIDIEAATVRAARHHTYDYYFEIDALLEKGSRTYCLACDNAQELAEWFYTLTYQQRMESANAAAAAGASSGGHPGGADASHLPLPASPPSNNPSIGAVSPPVLDSDESEDEDSGPPQQSGLRTVTVVDESQPVGGDSDSVQPMPPPRPPPPPQSQAVQAVDQVEANTRPESRTGDGDADGDWGAIEASSLLPHVPMSSAAVGAAVVDTPSRIRRGQGRQGSLGSAEEAPMAARGGTTGSATATAPTTAAAASVGVVGSQSSSASASAAAAPPPPPDVPPPRTPAISPKHQPVAVATVDIPTVGPVSGSALSPPPPAPRTRPSVPGPGLTADTITGSPVASVSPVHSMPPSSTASASVSATAAPPASTIMTAAPTAPAPSSSSSASAPNTVGVKPLASMDTFSPTPHQPPTTTATGGTSPVGVKPLASMDTFSPTPHQPASTDTNTNTIGVKPLASMDTFSPSPHQPTSTAITATPTPGLPPSHARAGDNHPMAVTPLESPMTFLSRANVAPDTGERVRLEKRMNAALAANASAEKLIDSLRDELAATGQESAFLAKQLETSNTQLTALRMQAEHAESSRQEGLRLVSKLSAALSRAEELLAKREEDVTRLNRSLEETNRRLAQREDETKLRELEWEAEKEALHAALAQATRAPPATHSLLPLLPTSVNSPSMTAGAVSGSGSGSGSVPAVRTDGSGVFSVDLPTGSMQVDSRGLSSGDPLTITLSPSPKRGGGGGVGAPRHSVATLGEAVADEFGSKEFGDVVTEFQPALAHIFSTLADLPPRPGVVREDLAKQRAADGFSPIMCMSRGAFTKFATDTQLLQSTSVGSMEASDVADVAFDMVTREPSDSSTRPVPSPRSISMTFGQFIAGVLVLAHARLGPKHGGSAGGADGPHLVMRKVVTEWLLPVIPPHVLARLKQRKAPPAPASSIPSPSSGPAATRGSRDLAAAASQHPRPSSPLAPPPPSSPSTDKRGRLSVGPGTASSVISRSSSFSSRLRSRAGVDRTPSPRGGRPIDRSEWLSVRNVEGPPVLREASPESRFSASALASHQHALVPVEESRPDAMRRSGSPTSRAAQRQEIRWSMDLPGVKEVFARDARPLKSIFNHYINTRPINYRTAAEGPNDKWTFADLTRFAHDFRLTPGMTSLQHLLKMVRTVVRSGGAGGTTLPRSTDTVQDSMTYKQYLDVIGRIAMMAYTQRPPFKAPAYAVMAFFQALDRSEGRKKMELRDGTTLRFASRSAFRP